MKTNLIALFVAIGAFATSAGHLYVDANDPYASDEPCAGRGTESLPYATIQAAVTAAEADGSGYSFAVGDKILVKPGVYSNGVTTVTGYGATRVVLSKPIRLESTGGKDVTAIEGRYDPSTSWGTEARQRHDGRRHDEQSVCVDPEGA